MVAGGATCSFFAGFACEFFKWRTIDGEPIDGIEVPPEFEFATAGEIGLFGYKITESERWQDIDGCQRFDDNFTNLDFGGGLHEASQWCAILAFIFACISFFVNLLEMIVCSFFCSFMFAATFLFLAAGFQAATFMVLGDADFW